jgi:hypothetical protein
MKPLNPSLNRSLSRSLYRSLFLLWALCSLLSAPARAGIIIGTLSPITTASTNSSTFVTNTVYLNLPVVLVANNGLAITNAYSGLFRYSFDNTTFYTNASPVFYPTVTNAASYTIQAQAISVPIYIQLLAITNSANTVTINIGASTP